MQQSESVLVDVEVSDPWDFGTVHGTGPFRAKLIGIDSDPNALTSKAGLIVLEEPLSYKGEECKFFVAHPRLESDRMENILNNITVNCCLTRISEEQAESDTPFDLSWWRGGGITLSGTIRKI